MFGIIPKEEKFFDLFESATKNVHAGAMQLLEFVQRYDDIEERAKRLHDIEHAGDQFTNETVQKLNTTFITPLDREDIHDLIGRIDDILDLMDEAVNRMVLYKIKQPTEDALKLAQCIRHATALLVEAMPLLRDMKNAPKLLELCTMIHTQENEADRIEQHALASLFENHHDARDIIKWKDIYQDLESATDRCEDAANVIQGIVLKNA